MSNPYATDKGYTPAQPGQYQAAYPTINPNQQQPQYEPYDPTLKGQSGGETEEERFNYSGSKCQDKWFAVLFLLHLVAIVACAVIYGRKVVSTGTSPILENKTNILLSLGAAAAAGLVFGAIWLFIMKKFSGVIITLSIVLNAVLFAAMAGYAMIKGSVWLAIVFVVFALLQVLYFYCVRHRIPFTKAVMTSAVSSVQDNPGSINSVYACALFSVAWNVMWVWATVGIYQKFYPDSTAPQSITAAHGIVFFLLLVSFYWTGQVLQNIGHVTVSGSVASWWLVPQQPAPTCGAFKRAMTTSFGSICFGSLLVAVLQAVRAVLRQAREQARRRGSGGAACLLCCVDCILTQLEALIRYFNMYAYTHVAIYGKDFISSAKDTWRMFSQRGFEVLINDDLTGLVLMMGCFLGALFSAAVAGVLGMILFKGASQDEVWVSLTAIGFLIGFTMTALIMSAVQSAVATTYVVWAEMPNEISQTRPNHYNNLVEASRILHPEQNF